MPLIHKTEDFLHEEATSSNFDDKKDPHRDSVFEIDTTEKSFWGRVKILCLNDCFVLLVAAGFFRFFGGYSLGFLYAGFFEDRYPHYTN